FFFQAEDGIRDGHVTGVQTCALPISYAVGENDIVLKVEDPGKKIFTFGLVGPDGKPIPTYGTHTVGDYRVLRIFEKPPEGAALRSEERRVGKEWRARR